MSRKKKNRRSKEEVKKNTQQSSELEVYQELLNMKRHPFVKIDSELNMYRDINKFKKSILPSKIILLTILILMIAGFTGFTINTKHIDDNSKMIALSGYVIIISILLPIFQHIWNKDNVQSNRKIEQHLLLQNQLMILTSNLSEQDKELVQKVLWRIEHLDRVTDEESLSNDLDIKIKEIGDTIQKKEK